MKLGQKIYNTEEIVIHSPHLQCNQNCLLAGQWGSVGSLCCKENVSAAWRKLFGIFFVEWTCYHWILLFFLHLQYLYPVIPQDYFWCIWNAGLTLLFFQNLKYTVQLHVQHLFYKKFPVIWIIVPIHVRCLFVGCCLQGFVSLSLIYSVYKMYLRVVFFDFILLVFTQDSRIILP